jgi:hypothetical protein
MGFILGKTVEVVGCEREGGGNKLKLENTLKKRTNFSFFKSPQALTGWG